MSFRHLRGSLSNLYLTNRVSSLWLFLLLISIWYRYQQVKLRSSKLIWSFQPSFNSFVYALELEIVLLWWCWRKITIIQSWELSNIRSVKGNRSDKKSVRSNGLPHTNTWNMLLWIVRLLDQDLVTSCIVIVV